MTRHQTYTPEQHQKKLEYHRQYYQDNKQKLLLDAKNYRLTHPEVARKASKKHSRKRSGVDLSTITPQQDTCEVCHKITKTHLDHCHSTKKFRGWLCGNCNRALGMAKDNPDTLRKLAEYLEGSHKLWS